MKKPIDQKHLFIKSFLRYFISACIPTLLIGGMAVFLAGRLLEQYARSFSEQPVQHVLQYFEQISNFSASLADLVNQDSYGGGSLKDILQDDSLSYVESIRLAVFSEGVNALTNNTPAIQSVYIYWPSTSGRILESNRGLVLPDMLADNAWLEACPPDFAQMPQQIWFARRNMPTGHSLSRTVITVYRKISSLDYQHSQGLIAIHYKLENMEAFLSSQALFSHQKIAVVDSTGQLLVGALAADREGLLQPVMQAAAEQRPLRLNTAGYTISSAPLGDTGLTLISCIPNAQLYAVPYRLVLVTLAAVGAVLVLSLALAARYSANTAAYVQHILDVFDAAQNGRELPPSPAIKDEQSYILNRLIYTFVQQEYLNVQLAEKDYQARAMELTALQAQINPHFLFNTMETIKFRAFSLTGGVNDVPLLIENLSSILRYTLREPQRLVPLSQELEYAKAYLWIQNFRFRDVFRVEWHCDPDANDFLLPKLILQPLIENAIRHGIRPAGHPCVLQIEVKYAAAHTLMIKVQDNGVGMTAAQLETLRKDLAREDLNCSHIGLRNTAKRLSLLYCKKAKIIVNSMPDQGTTVCIYIPHQCVLPDSPDQKDPPCAQED